VHGNKTYRINWLFILYTWFSSKLPNGCKRTKLPHLQATWTSRVTDHLTSQVTWKFVRCQKKRSAELATWRSVVWTKYTDVSEQPFSGYTWRWWKEVSRKRRTNLTSLMSRRLTWQQPRHRHKNVKSKALSSCRFSLNYREDLPAQTKATDFTFFGHFAIMALHSDGYCKCQMAILLHALSQWC
jgi:hypothetical protein